MAIVLEFKPTEKREELATTEAQWKYALHTGMCPKCGKELRVLHQCRRCLSFEASCTCGWGVLRD